jgi:hypothetical protein
MLLQILRFLIFTIMLAACSPESENAAREAPVAVKADTSEKSLNEESTRARAAIGEFATALQAELKRAMKHGGPVNAIGVCNTTAMPITETVSLEQGLELSRVSLKNRNPANAAEGWQKKILESFETRQAAGEDPAILVWSGFAEVDGKQQFRFMKAIPTGELCLQCHGKNISPDVNAKLAELYPEDKATAYSAGDIRGAFVVTRNLP